MNRKTIGLLLMGLAASGAGCAGRRPACPAPESFRDEMISDFQGRPALAVSSVPRAPESCPGPGHPVLRISAPGADGWIHIVTAGVPDPRTGKSPWVFVDISSADRENGVPLYARGPVFWDNPGWGRPAGTLVWEGEVFPVKIRGNQISALGGVGWGFRWEPDREGPDPIAPRPLPARSWAGRRALLAAEFRRWEFGQ